MQHEDLIWIPTSVTIVIGEVEYKGYKPGLHWFIYALEICRLSRLGKQYEKT
jgi:hypothetical protein